MVLYSHHNNLVIATAILQQEYHTVTEMLIPFNTIYITAHKMVVISSQL